MKIAICISGQPRNYEKGYLELKKWFLDKYDCDVYIHTWKDDLPMEAGHKFAKERQYEFTDKDYNNIVELYKPKTWDFQNTIPFDTTNIKGAHLNYKLNSLLSASYSIHACYNLVRDWELEYDLIIRTRFDLEFTDYISPECLFLKDLSLLDPNKLNVFEYPLTNEGDQTRHSEIDDLFAVSSPKIAGIYADYFTYALSYIYMDNAYKSWLDTVISENPDPIHPESVLKYHLISNGVEINYIKSLTEHFTANILR
jgi:hypothetical protein|tara:strand:- start:329 stop:1093 length:765 start_codon:yes stop_codon:yes gene_type:complete